jgi:hypothetical protein
MTLTNAFIESKIFTLKSGGSIFGKLVKTELCSQGIVLLIDGSRGQLPPKRWRILASRVVKMERYIPVSVDDLADFETIGGAHTGFSSRDLQ